MELNEETINSLAINEVSIMKKIAEELSIKMNQVSSVVGLIAEGCTIPFISRYRKEQHGSLDEVQVTEVSHRFSSYSNLETRRIEIIKGIFSQGKLTEDLFNNLQKAGTLTELEDIYAPYKRKKKTRGMVAIEKGLEPLAEAMLLLSDEELRAKAAEFVRENAEAPELTVASVDDALQGAMDIIAERTAQNTENRALVKDFYKKDATLIVTGVGDAEKAKTSVYQMYWDYKEPLASVKPHRVLAINRGEREGQLEVSIDADENTATERLWARSSINNQYHRTAIEEGVKRLLSPAVLRELRGDESDVADKHGISVFSENLKNLLMQQPIKGTRVLGLDPGIRTGTKCAALDDTGKYLGYFLIRQHDKEASKEELWKAIKKYDIQLIAVGNGTGSKEVQEVVSELIAEKSLEVLYTVVDEDGASVYSASDIAREEFPDLDLTIRGAISIGRRLQDPLAELVKIDPKAIGVGLYQHDVNQKSLSDTLDEVVGSVVNNVGVNLNTASFFLLKYVSGINSSLAKKIVNYRDANGRITSRDELKKVPGMGPKSYEQSAGFLKIPESPNPLDNTWVHPENYALATEIRALIADNKTVTAENRKAFKETYSVGDTTIDDIVNELKKPNRDPREDFPKPLMQKGVVNFEDLKEAMVVTGKVKNVVDFGAFVDIGIKETALLHISEMSDTYVEDPMDVLKVGDVKEFRIIGLDLDRRRISLSLKSDKPQAKSDAAPARTEGPRPEARGGQPARGPGDRQDQRSYQGGNGQRPGRPDGRRDGRQDGRASGADAKRYSAREDDGTTYNPFAEAFKKAKK